MAPGGSAPRLYQLLEVPALPGLWLHVTLSSCLLSQGPCEDHEAAQISQGDFPSQDPSRLRLHDPLLLQDDLFTGDRCWGVDIFGGQHPAKHPRGGEQGRDGSRHACGTPAPLSSFTPLKDLEAAQTWLHFTDGGTEAERAGVTLRK